MKLKLLIILLFLNLNIFPQEINDLYFTDKIKYLQKINNIFKNNNLIITKDNSEYIGKVVNIQINKNKDCLTITIEDNKIFDIQI